MWKRRVGWLGWLFCAACLHLFGNSYGTLAILGCSALVPPLFMLLSALAARHLSAELTGLESGGKEKPVRGVLRITQGSLLPAFCFECRIVCENALTGERLVNTVRGFPAPRRTVEIPLELDVKHCGALRISAGELALLDPFRLRRARVGFHSEKSVLISPEIFDIKATLTSDLNAVVDSDKYSMTQPGNDPSETYAVREYAPGDSIKNIHWKLSQKSDALMVRELSLPIVERMLLLYESSVLPELCEIAPCEIDVMANVFISLSHALCRQDVRHAIGWRDSETKLYVGHTIDSADDLSAALPAFLSNTVKIADTTVCGCFADENAPCAYAHVAVVSKYMEPDVAALCNGNRVTVLCASDAADGGGMQPDGVFLRPFSCSAYSLELTELEL